MSDRIPDADHAVDEQKRRARRRLVGAVVLAAAAAVILPMLLEKEPQPLGEDVSVQIPPVDEGKFVNRLTRSKSGDTPPSAKSDTKGAAAKPEAPKADAAKADAAKAETSSPDGAKPAASEAPPAKSATEGTGAAAPAAPAASAPTPVAPGVAPEQRAPAATATKPAPELPSSAPTKSSPAPAAAAPADTKSAPPAGFAVQLAAFSDDKGANAYANKLRKAGYAAAHVEAVDTGHGKLWRVRVGGFATRAEAEAARVKLESKGFGNGMVAPAR